ncbi:ABC transporter permease subunit [Bacillus sp. FSL K6-3431]|uniref:ABC transporter permease subunit n=1 Tax=Bacillus sp. FSL K6-3431 TaxID=2921500 RepID=UPI004046B357
MLDQLVEAAKIDNASDFHIFLKIVLQISLPIIAVMALSHGVSLWNQSFPAIFIKSGTISTANYS